MKYIKRDSLLRKAMRCKPYIKQKEAVEILSLLEPRDVEVDWGEQTILVKGWNFTFIWKKPDKKQIHEDELIIEKERLKYRDKWVEEQEKRLEEDE